MGGYGKLLPAWSRGVAAEHAALSRPRSRVRIPSGPPKECRALHIEALFLSLDL